MKAQRQFDGRSGYLYGKDNKGMAVTHVGHAPLARESYQYRGRKRLDNLWQLDPMQAWSRKWGGTNSPLFHLTDRVGDPFDSMYGLYGVVDVEPLYNVNGIDISGKLMQHVPRFPRFAAFHGAFNPDEDAAANLIITLYGATESATLTISRAVAAGVTSETVTLNDTITGEDHTDTRTVTATGIPMCGALFHQGGSIDAYWSGGMLLSIPLEAPFQPASVQVTSDSAATWVFGTMLGYLDEDRFSFLGHLTTELNPQP